MKSTPSAAPAPGKNPEAAGDQSRAAFAIDMFGRRYRLAAEDRAFWTKVAAGAWERDTLRFFARALDGRRGRDGSGAPDADSVCVDVGAWIGATALFAAPMCGTVYALEPDPAAYERLLANLRMNAVANIVPCHAALTAADGCVCLSNHRHFGNSMTRAQAATGDGAGDGTDAGDGAGENGDGDIGGNRATVLGLRLASFIAWWGIARIDLLKIDIEGGEFALLPALLELPMRLRPVVHLSLHAPFFPAAERAGKLAAVAELAAQYAHLYDQNNARITARDITQNPDYRDKFQVVAMSARALF
ncbi:MAG: FkbM family methyltransferase [Gammaproteobacteria bacterium]|nr:FkbM family methyltransferase [Gammaproteobacteria bacterium]